MTYRFVAAGHRPLQMTTIGPQRRRKRLLTHPQVAPPVSEKNTVFRDVL